MTEVISIRPKTDLSHLTWKPGIATRQGTAIQWAAETFNPWWGCTEIAGSLACIVCYARELDRRRKFQGYTHWGPGVKRYRTSDANWAEPLKWNQIAKEIGEIYPDKGRCVFCASMGDVFDNEVNPQWRVDLFRLIRRTPYLRWLLLTKRPGLIRKMVPPEWPIGYEHVTLMCSVDTQAVLDRDVRKLVEVEATTYGLSIEPQTERIDLRRALDLGVRFVIMGGCSRQGKGLPVYRYDVEWAREGIAQCREYEARPFIKQLGSNPFLDGKPLKLKDGHGGEMSEWPEDIRVREWPAALR